MDVNGQSIKDIIKWSDDTIENNLKYIYWLFPDVSTLNKKDIDILTTSKRVRNRIIKITIRMLDFYGYKIDSKNDSVKQIKELYRCNDAGFPIGLFSVRNFQLITQIMNFLLSIQMKKLSGMVFLALCHALQHNKQFKTLVKNENYFPLWMATQPYMSKTKEYYNSDNMSFDDPHLREQAEEWDSESSEEDDEMHEENNSSVEFEPWDEPEFSMPSFRGLNYIKNSCYIDSVLLALFAIPNKILDKNILKKDLSYISQSKKKWIGCGRDVNSDFFNRKQVQNELNRIANSMRGMEQVRDCTMLRKYLENCPGSQEFHRGGMQDAGEFLLYLFNIFEVGIMTKHRVTYVTNSTTIPPENVVQTFQEFQISSPVYNISSHRLRTNKSLDIRDFLKDIEDARLSSDDLYRDPDTGIKYKRRIEINKVISTPYIVFNAQRLYSNGSRSHTPIKFPDKIKIGKNVLILQAVIVHENHHYTCYIKYNKFWYHYDDITNSTKWLGELSNRRGFPDPEKNGILFFYTI
jgi:hypothetical protein